MAETTHMSWAFLVSVLAVAVTGAAVLPRRRRRESHGFPWFWVVFPAAVFGVMSTLGMILARLGTKIYPTYDDSVGLSMPYPAAGGFPGLEFLPDGQFQRLFGPLPYEVYVWFFPVTGIACTVASVIAWRKGRI
ncbi:hypothetical protein PQI66_00020 [Corynebacterium sp. USCH3]|uniref:hypothetical protein n=1 Tax=Corynebacterium sp. USCH3 TaxID=3024840 RepID=UPI0030A69009